MLISTDNLKLYMNIKTKKFTKKILTKKNLSKNFAKKRKIRLNQKNFIEKILQIKRVTKVIKGGKRLSFRAILVIGDKIQKIGIGIGKGNNVSLAIEKAKLNAKKNLIKVPITFKKSIPHLIVSSFCASKVMLRPASQGTGIIAGSSVRAVLELSGLENVLSKELGSNNILNNALATIKALQQLNHDIWCSKILSNKKKRFYNFIFKKS